jgi:hypothetical protein
MEDKQKIEEKLQKAKVKAREAQQEITSLKKELSKKDIPAIKPEDLIGKLCMITEGGISHVKVVRGYRDGRFLVDAIMQYVSEGGRRTELSPVDSARPLSVEEIETMTYHASKPVMWDWEAIRKVYPWAAVAVMNKGGSCHIARATIVEPLGEWWYRKDGKGHSWSEIPSKYLLERPDNWKDSVEYYKD